MAGAHDNDGNSPDDLPDLPEEWGVIVIPDDLSELSDEVEAIRAELRQSDRSDRWRRLFDRPGLRQLRRLGLALLRAPVLIISMAVLVTVASLFASAWPGPPRQPVVQRTDDESLPAIDLVGDDGRPVPLRGKLPAVILVTDGCPCEQLISETAAAAKARPQVAVVVIAAALSSATGTPSATGKPGQATPGQGTANQGTTNQATAGQSAANQATASQGAANQGAANQGAATQGTATGSKATPSAAATTSTRATPPTQTTPQNQNGPSVLVLHEPPSANVRAQLQLGPPDGTAGALFVDSKGRIVKRINRTASAGELEPYLAQI
jgi:hypothetical protein